MYLSNTRWKMNEMMNENRMGRAFCTLLYHILKYKISSRCRFLNLTTTCRLLILDYRVDWESFNTVHAIFCHLIFDRYFLFSNKSHPSTHFSFSGIKTSVSFAVHLLSINRMKIFFRHLTFWAFYTSHESFTVWV